MYYFLKNFLSWKPDPSQNVKTDRVLRFDDQWEPGRFSSPMRINKQVLIVVLTGWFWLRNRTETQRQFSADEWEPPNTGQNQIKLSLAQTVVHFWVSPPLEGECTF